MVSPSIRYLLPLSMSERASVLDSDDEDEEEDDSDDVVGGDHTDVESTVALYAQAKPLVHPHSSAAIKTLGTMLNDPELVRRMLQRNQKRAAEIDSEAIESVAATTLSERARSHRAAERLECLVVCEELVLRFDPRARESREIRLAAVKQLLAYYRLDVDDVAYRRWQQRLPEDADRVTVTTLAQALMLWFSSKVLLERFADHEQRSPSKQTMALETSSNDRVRVVQKPNTATVLEKTRSVPLLHPFTLLTQHNDVATAFDYDKCVTSLPRVAKTLDETKSLESKLIIHTTHELRRKTKILSRLDPQPSPASARSMALVASSSSPSLGAAAPAPTTASTGAMNQTYERLHQEKLARDVLQRCSMHSLAPSNRVKVSKLTPQIRQQKAQHALAKHTRQQNVETAKAFSASIAMISRHIQNEELRDARELRREQRAELVDERKQWGREHRAHCRALADERTQQHLRDVHAMKAIAREELEIVRNYLEQRQDVLKCNKQPFALSESTSTLFQSPPEILAAKATAMTAKQKRKLLATEREHLDHVRSLQLLDYVYDKRRAVMEALKPKADAALVEVELVADAAAESSLPSLGELLEQLRAQGQDLSVFLPPPNSPPAALKYFGTSRPAPLPPFASSTERHLAPC